MALRAKDVGSEFFTPREYQVELFEHTTVHDSVILLPAGSGKTYIAILLMKYMTRYLGKNKQTVIFIAEKKVLARQHYEHICINTNLKASIWETDTIDALVKDFKQIVCDNDVVVITASVLMNALTHAAVSIADFALVIMDECHHALNPSHPFRFISRVIKKHKRSTKSDLPRVLGLTMCALVGKIQPEKFDMCLEALESITGARVISSSTALQNAKFSPRPNECIFICNVDIVDGIDLSPLHKLAEFAAVLGDFADSSQLDARKLIASCVRRVLQVMEDCGVYCAYNIAMNSHRQFKKALQHENLPEKQTIVLMSAISSLETFCLPLHKTVGNCSSYSEISKYLSSRVIKMVEILEAFNACQVEKQQQLCAIIFVAKRTCAMALCHLLRNLAKSTSQLRFIKADYAIGTTAMANKFNETDSRRADKRFNESISNFRNGVNNVMVATLVLEEGIDIRNCNLVIRANAPTNFNSYIQSRGRARNSPSMYAIIANEMEYHKVHKDLSVYRRMEKVLHNHMNSCRNIKEEKVKEIGEDNLNIDEVDYEEYTTTSGACVTTSTAISLVNRYCARLPSDVFTRLAPIIRTRRMNGGFVSELHFPINCPVKEVAVSRLCSTIKKADMSVALDAVKLLHKRGELDDNLITKDKVTNMQELACEFGEYASNIPRETGSAKKRRLYGRKVAVALSKPLPRPDQPFYVYVIELDLVEPIPDDSNPKRRKLINPKMTPYSFGLCSVEKIPPVPPFPVYQRQGKVITRFKLLHERITLSAEKLELVKKFHAYLFDQILGMRNDMEFAPERASFSNLLIPLKKPKGSRRFVLDQQVLEDTLKGFPPPLTKEQRKNFVYDPKNYTDAVVKPWYRPNDTDVYYIGEVITYVYPRSAFGAPKFPTFNHYFAEKYQITIYNQGQHLLDVDNTSNRFNLLLPRAAPTRVTKRAADHTQKQFMVPELVSIHPMPASFWIMVIELPTILYRMNALLLADEFRECVVRNALRMKVSLPKDFEWDTLEYNVSGGANGTVRTLEQLRKANEANEEKALSAANRVNDKGDQIFDISVWDPNDGTPFQNSPLNLQREQPRKATVAMSDELSDDEEMLNQINIDIACFGKEMLYRNNERKCDYPELGWEDPRLPAASHISEAQLSISSTKGVNVASLMQDIESFTPGRPIQKVHAPTHEMFADVVADMDEQDHIDAAFRMLGAEHFAIDRYVRTQCYTTSEEELDEKVDYLTSSPNMDSLKKSHSPKREHFCMLPLLERVHAPVLPDAMLPWFRPDSTDKHPYGVPPTLLLQALTTSSASDGFNLERLETIGDSFLKLSVTNYLYHKHPNQNEGDLSYVRSREVSNANLFKLGKKQGIACIMECCKFDPGVNWLPPGYITTAPNFDPDIVDVDDDEQQRHETGNWIQEESNVKSENGIVTFDLVEPKLEDLSAYSYNYFSQQNIPDKAIADCVEALIGAHLISVGSNYALDFMQWIGIKVDVCKPYVHPPSHLAKVPDMTREEVQTVALDIYTSNRFENLEKIIGYTFKDKFFLVQAFTHASYQCNPITGCYQRLEFLGDAVLDFLITRYLFDYNKQYSPGVLTDLRSALVNNVIFASLAVKNRMNEYLLLHSSSLLAMIDRFVSLHQQKGEVNFNDEMFMVTEDEVLDPDQAEEDVEVPKALGDIFESLAGAIYLDTDMDLQVVWRVFYRIMKETIEKCCLNPPQSPIRELFEMKSHRVRFTKVERLVEKNAARVTVEIDNGKFRFVGIGRSYRIAKTTAAKKALRYLRTLDKDRKQEQQT